MGDSRFDDSRFDALLADALRQVNLEEAAAQSRTEEPDFSPAYRRDRLRLLADPMGWYRRRTGGRKRQEMAHQHRINPEHLEGES